MKFELLVSPESTCAWRTNFTWKITVLRIKTENVPEEVPGREEAGGPMGRSAGVGPQGTPHIPGREEGLTPWQPPALAGKPAAPRPPRPLTAQRASPHSPTLRESFTSSFSHSHKISDMTGAGGGGGDDDPHARLAPRPVARTTQAGRMRGGGGGQPPPAPAGRACAAGRSGGCGYGAGRRGAR